MSLKRPVLGFTITDEKEYVDPRSLEDYQVGDTVALILLEDLKNVITLMEELLDDYKALYDDYQEAQEVIKKHVMRGGNSPPGG